MTARFLPMLLLAACASAPATPVAAPTPPAPAPHHLADPDLQPREAPRRLLAIDWAHVALHDDAEALALWRQIAPTGEDWDRKLDEIPTGGPIARQLAGALLRGGNLACAPMAAPRTCAPAPTDLPAPMPASTFDDPCLRRLLALWALGQVEDADRAGLHDALRAIAALPPPESELVAAAIGVVPEADPDARLELIEIAAAHGQAEIANRLAGALDEPHLLAAATRLHLPGALEVLSAEGHRAAYLAAIADEQMPAAARAQAIVDVLGADDTLAADARAALVAAAGSTDCAVAARAARALADRGDPSFLPRRPTARTPAAAMRALCVLASVERLQGADERSLLPAFVPARGLTRIVVGYDPLADRDRDGDGDPHTTRTTDLIAAADATLPELDEMVRALARCTGTTCASRDHEFRFTWKPTGPGGVLQLAEIVVTERPPCASAPSP